MCIQTYIFKYTVREQVPWLKPVILATQEAEIRMELGSQYMQNFNQCLGIVVHTCHLSFAGKHK
jgi:hypothetical protein